MAPGEMPLRMRDDLPALHQDLGRIVAAASRLRVTAHDHARRSELELLQASCRDAWRRLDHATPGELDRAVQDVRAFIGRAEAVLRDLRAHQTAAASLRTPPRDDSPA